MREINGEDSEWQREASNRLTGILAARNVEHVIDGLSVAIFISCKNKKDEKVRIHSRLMIA